MVGMLRYEIQIFESDVSPGPLASNQPTPEVRSVVTTQKAADEAAAIDGAWRFWDAKYGPDERPAEGAFIVKARGL
jgi:hypothetical protein